MSAKNRSYIWTRRAPSSMQRDIAIILEMLVRYDMMRLGCRDHGHRDVQSESTIETADFSHL